MMILHTGKLPDGRAWEIECFQPDGTFCSELFHHYFISSFAVNAKFPNADLGYWLADLNKRFTGAYMNECADTFYALKLEGTYAARMWWSYSKRTGIGNFGHVCTEPAYRKLGLLNCLMLQFKEDFAKSKARIAGCATGNPIAAKCYMSHGFQMPYGGETGPLFYGEDFKSMAEDVYQPGKIKMIRNGDAGDQFGCDKFLSNSPGVYRLAATTLLPDFRTALLEQQFGRAAVCVAENEKGYPVGYSFAYCFGKKNFMDLLIHPAYAGEKEFLLQKAKEFFAERFPEKDEPILFE